MGMEYAGHLFEITQEETQRKLLDKKDEKHIIRCRRCNKWYEPYDGMTIGKGGQKFDGFVLSHSDAIGNPQCSKYIHLCPWCMTELIQWLEDGSE